MSRSGVIRPAFCPSLAKHESVGGAVWALLPAVAFAGYLRLDWPMYRFVAARRGPVFVAYFVAMHFLLNLVIAVAAGVGVFGLLSSRTFRRLYDKPAEAL
ncbi:hypothetical protein [Salinispora cortesiana]|uniref:hypothetical protein n=1 Tax=Salinispora cortesiana TaxID=1305843 RepID=UPI0003F525F6|nr:hypothetical protein [Salinispora cortesiana]